MENPSHVSGAVSRQLLLQCCRATEAGGTHRRAGGLQGYNCVLNLVDARHKRRLFDEIFRVLKNGGRAVISDIVSDEEVPEALQKDPMLWSGCISGVLTEDGFLKAFQDDGFYGIEILKRDKEPWRTVEGIEFRSVTVQAWKRKQGPCFERNQAVVYKAAMTHPAPCSS